MYVCTVIPNVFSPDLLATVSQMKDEIKKMENRVGELVASAVSSAVSSAIRPLATQLRAVEDAVKTMIPPPQPSQPPTLQHFPPPPTPSPYPFSPVHSFDSPTPELPDPFSAQGGYLSCLPGPSSGPPPQTVLPPPRPPPVVSFLFLA